MLARHTSRTHAQRGANGHPVGAGSAPAAAAAAGAASCRLASNERVYGCWGCENSSTQPAVSMTRPANITSTRSAMRASSARSWVTQITLMPVCSSRSATRDTICACTVTSRAVVGSSAISTRGSPARAMAMVTRWRMPPENSCGYCRMRRTGSAIPTRISSSMARSRACTAPMPKCCRSTSVICRPMLSTGFSAVSGSWKTIATSRPRTRSSSARDRLSSSCSPSCARVACAVAPGGSSCSSASMVRLLPEPDSPTMPRVSPRCRLKLTSATAACAPRHAPGQ